MISEGSLSYKKSCFKKQKQQKKILRGWWCMAILVNSLTIGTFKSESQGDKHTEQQGRTQARLSCFKLGSYTYSVIFASCCVFVCMRALLGKCLLKLTKPLDAWDPQGPNRKAKQKWEGDKRRRTPGQAKRENVCQDVEVKGFESVSEMLQ